ncbi:MAG TPA: UbiD family decarboxylase, partial [Thermoguttaceae bacterium]|nr:UbiD family decarboxylase [Thermoguttaceae bacterium]
MSYATLADFLEELDRLGQLRSGDATADMPEAARLHRNLGGDDVPCVTGLLATEERICRALGVASPEEVAERLGRLLAAQSVRAAACESVAQVVDGALAKFAPRPARVGSCQKVVRLGDDVDLQQLPVPCDGPDMARRTITTGQIGSRDPASGRAWLGHAELSIHSRRELVLHVAPYEPLAELLAAYRKAGEPTPLAVALGGNPVCLPAAMGPVPMPIDGLALAGFLAGGSIDVVRCRTLDLWVP